MESISKYLEQKGYAVKEEPITEKELDELIAETNEVLGYNINEANEEGTSKRGWNLFGFFAGMLGMGKETEAQKAKRETKEASRKKKEERKRQLKAQRDKVKAALVRAKAAFKENQKDIKQRNKLRALEQQEAELKSQQQFYEKGGDGVLYSEEQAARIERGMDKCAQGMDPEERDTYDSMRTQLQLATLKAEDKNGNPLTYDPKTKTYKNNKGETVDRKDVKVTRCTAQEVAVNIKKLKDSQPEVYAAMEKELETRGIKISSMRDDDPAWQEIVQDVARTDVEEDPETIRTRAQDAEADLAAAQQLKQNKADADKKLKNLGDVTKKLQSLAEEEKAVTALEKVDSETNATPIDGFQPGNILNKMGENPTEEDFVKKCKEHGISADDAKKLFAARPFESTPTEDQQKLIGTAKENAKKELKHRRELLNGKRKSIVADASAAGVTVNDADNYQTILDNVNAETTKVQETFESACRAQGIDPKNLDKDIEERQKTVQEANSNLHALEEEGSHLQNLLEISAEEAQQDADESDPKMKEEKKAITNKMEGLDRNECYVNGKRGFWEKDKDNNWIFHEAPTDEKEMKKYTRECNQAAVLYPDNPANTDKPEGNFADPKLGDIYGKPQPEIKHILDNGQVVYQQKDADGNWVKYEPKAGEPTGQELEILQRQRPKNAANRKKATEEFKQELKKAMAATEPDEHQKELIAWAKGHSDDLADSEFIDGKDWDSLQGELEDWDPAEAGIAVDGEDEELNDETDAEKNDKTADRENGKRVNPSKIWKQRTIKDGPRKGERTKSYYNQKGDSLSEKSFKERMKKYEEYVKSHKKKTEGLTQDSSNMLTEHIGLRDYLTHRWS